MRTSEQTNEISAALALAQAEYEPAVKDCVNPHFGNRYASIGSLQRATRPALSKQGISDSASETTDFITGTVTVTTRLTHKSGQWMESDAACKPKGLLPQDVGAANTYMRRYSYSNVTGVELEEDDDGESTTDRVPDRKEDAKKEPLKLNIKKPDTPEQPQRDQGPKPQPPKRESGDDYVIDLGIFKGKTVNDLTVQQVEQQIHYWTVDPKSEKYRGKKSELFVSKLREHLATLASSLVSDDLPDHLKDIPL